jgi:SAM-dependent methyltransferase
LLVDVRRRDVLNVGSSFGWYEQWAIGAGARSVTGVDTSERSVNVATAVAPEATFLVASALDLPFDDGSFDVVTLFDVLEHLPAGTEQLALAELHRVLRPGGKLALTTPNWHWLPTITDPAWYFGHRHYRIETVAGLLNGSFIIEDQWISGGLFDQVELLVYYVSRHLFRRERHPFDSLRRLADREWSRRDGWNTVVIVARAKER